MIPVAHRARAQGPGTARPVLVLLPGLEATGLLLDEFVTALTARFDVHLLTYPRDRALGYAELTDYVRDRLPRRPYVLVAESFSGPIALRLAAQGGPDLRGVVLAASFATLPLPVKPLLSTLASWVSPRRVPIGVVSAVLWGRWANSEREALLARSLALVEPTVLSARVRAALSVSVDLAALPARLPLIYLQAACDRLITGSAARRIQRERPSTKLRRFDAPHFLLQVRPAECAAEIEAFVDGLQLSRDE
ncbi:alpha/beta fold hydrolase [Montanilutibacter psychrotolerans]|uniref:alpha/beta fold hydrolase n=1 Tax=Montanilutibacter psychrotolerans TaxID=1327343 RepID=UPI001680A222|nr:alpha/beta hydrolase [Lysobacter psychrotolerans]